MSRLGTNIRKLRYVKQSGYLQRRVVIVYCLEKTVCTHLKRTNINNCNDL